MPGRVKQKRFRIKDLSGLAETCRRQGRREMADQFERVISDLRRSGRSAVHLRDLTDDQQDIVDFLKDYSDRIA